MALLVMPCILVWPCSRSVVNWTMALVVTSKFWAIQYLVKNANLFFHPVALPAGLDLPGWPCFHEDGPLGVRFAFAGCFGGVCGAFGCDCGAFGCDCGAFAGECGGCLACAELAGVECCGACDALAGVLGTSGDAIGIAFVACLLAWEAGYPPCEAA